MKQNNSRRKVLKMTGASVAGLNLVSVPAAAENSKKKKRDKQKKLEKLDSDYEKVSFDGSQTIRGAGIEKEYQNLVDELEFDQARKLLVKNDVTFTTRRRTLKADTNTPSSDGISTQDYWSKSDSSVTFDYAHFGGNEWGLQLDWELENQIDMDGPAPADKAALAYDDDVFGYRDDSLRHFGEIETSDGGPYIDRTETHKEPGTDEPNQGVVKFDDNLIVDDAVGDGYMQIIVRRIDENSEGIVSGCYTHTWSLGNLGLTNVTLKPNLAGIIEWSEGIGIDSWELPNNDDRDDQI